MIIDCHAHVGPVLEGAEWQLALGVHPACSAEDYVRAMDEAGVDVGIAVGRMDRNHEYQSDMQHRLGSRIRSFAFINPRDSDAPEQLRRGVEELKLSGLKLHGWRTQVSNADGVLLDPLLEICDHYRLPVTVHTMGDNPYTTPLHTEQMAKRWPEVNILLAHGGAEWSQSEALEVARRRPNITVDTAHMSTFWIREFVRMLGADRVAMGSDWPWWQLDVAVRAHEVALPDPEARSWVMGRTAARILNLQLTDTGAASGDDARQ
jgi:uncharacterized protein